MDPNQTQSRIRNRRGNYTCASCGTKFSRIDHLRRHEQAHRNGRRHACNFCGKAFNRQDVLDRHRVQVHKVDRSSTVKQNIVSQYTPPAFHNGQSQGAFEGRHSMLPVENWLDFDHNNSRFDGHPSLESTSFPDVPADDLYVSEEMDNIMPYPDHQFTNAPPDDFATEQIQLKRARLILEKPACAMGELFDFIDDKFDSSYTHRSVESVQPTRISPGPMRMLSHRLNIIEKESFFVAYRKGFLIPFVHLSSIDVLAASRDVFSDPERPRSTNESSLRLIPRSLFYAILAHGAAFVKQPELARTLYALVNKMLLQEFATLTRRQATKVPLHLVQVMIHQAIFGLSFGEPSLETDSERLMRSLVALFRDSETTDQFLGFDVSAAINFSKPRSHWIQQEEAKRAFYVTFWFLSASTLRLNHAPVIRLSDIKAELPCSDVVLQEQNEWSQFSELYTSIVEPQQDYNAPKHASTSDKTSAGGHEHVGGSTDAGSLSEFRFLILVAALHSEVWTWYMQHSSAAVRTAKDERAKSLQRAIRRLLGMCPTFQNLVPGSENYKFLVNAINVLDNTQLMLRVDLRAMKEVLLTRQFEKLNTDVVPSLVSESTALAGEEESAIDDETLIYSESEYPSRMESNQPKLDAAAVFSATALVSSAQTGQWWHSNGSWDLHLPSAIMAFSFIQILINWTLSRMEAMEYPLDSLNPASTTSIYQLLHRELVQLWECCSFINTPPVRFESPRSFIRLLLVISNSYAGFYRGQSTWPGPELQPL